MSTEYQASLVGFCFSWWIVLTIFCMWHPSTNWWACCFCWWNKLHLHLWLAFDWSLIGLWLDCSDIVLTFQICWLPTVSTPHDTWGFPVDDDSLTFFLSCHPGLIGHLKEYRKWLFSLGEHLYSGFALMNHWHLYLFFFCYHLCRSFGTGVECWCFWYGCKRVQCSNMFQCPQGWSIVQCCLFGSWFSWQWHNISLHGWYNNKLSWCIVSCHQWNPWVNIISHPWIWLVRKTNMHGIGIDFCLCCCS